MNTRPLSLYNFETQIIYQSENIEAGYQYLLTHPEYQIFVTKDNGQHLFNKIGVCLKYLDNESIEICEDALNRLDKAISKLLGLKWIGYTPSATIRLSTEQASSSTKKYYAVKVGRQPGVYTNWKDTCEQVLGFPGNIQKSFLTLEEALEFLR